LAGLSARMRLRTASSGAHCAALPCVGRIDDYRNDHAGEPHATVSPDDGGLNFLAFDRVVHVPALEAGPAALADAILQESVECSGGGRLRDVAGQMVFDPAVITARLSELLEAGR
jgi:hypothetical protein